VAPHVLPRETPAPVSVLLSGSVRSVIGDTLPRLRRITFAFGARGGLDTAGLPVCPRARLRNATRPQALSRCGGALVGHGSILVQIPLGPKRPLIAKAAALAFNGRRSGRPAVWMFAYSASPPVSFVLPFTLHAVRKGPYGLLLQAPLGRAFGPWPRLRAFRIELGRQYRSGGESHSYLSASCPLPPRFHHLDVPLARATYHFDPAPTVDVSISRPCKVRDAP
jgi:hypothetical protein